MKIGIGTAQFGLDYGISNTEGKTSIEEAKKILELAATEGVKVIDTAPAYGDSEEVLGKILSSNHNFDIVTKTPHFSNEIITNEDVNLLEATFNQSLIKLKQLSIYGLLAHNVNDLLKPNGQLLMNKMLDFKNSNKVKKIGVSVYTSEQIDAMLNKYSIDLIQLPINVFDQRLIESGHLVKLKKQGIEIHARSIFLQGLLLMEIEAIPPSLKFIENHLSKYYEFIEKNKINKIQAAIDFIKQIKEIDLGIFGLNNRQHLQELTNVVNSNNVNMKKINYQQFLLQDSLILNPSNWSISNESR